MDNNRKIIPIGELLERFSKGAEKEPSNVDQLTRLTHNRVDARRQAAVARFAAPKVETQSHTERPADDVEVPVKVEPKQTGLKPEKPKQTVAEQKKEKGRLVEEKVFNRVGEKIDVEKATERGTTDVDDFDVPVADFSQGIKANASIKSEIKTKSSGKPDGNDAIVKAVMNEPTVTVSDQPEVVAKIQPATERKKPVTGENIKVTQVPNRVQEIQARLRLEKDVAKTETLTVDQPKPIEAAEDEQTETSRPVDRSILERDRRWWWPFGGSKDKETATEPNDDTASQPEAETVFAVAKQTRRKDGGTAGLQELTTQRTEGDEKLSQAA